MNVKKDHSSSSSSSSSSPSSSIPKPLYQLSTQFRHWRFSRPGLEQARRELNQGAVGRVRSKLEEERNVELETSSDLESKEPSQIEYLTVQDELELVTFYLTKISQLSRASIFKFPETVEATAITYLKRFYLRNTCMDYHPKNIMSVDRLERDYLSPARSSITLESSRLTCLFLATKTENTSISIDQFASRIPKTTNEDVLDLEFLVAQSLKFQFKVHHAHLAARGIYLDLQDGSRSNPIPIDRLNQAWPHVSALLRVARITDLEFLWTPSQIGAAAWWIVDRDATESWLKLKADRASNPPTQNRILDDQKLGIDRLIHDLESISRVILDAQDRPIDKDRVTAVDRRLRFCRNPEKDPNSALYKLKQAELESAHLAKHREKYAIESNRDPFR